MKFIRLLKGGFLIGNQIASEGDIYEVRPMYDPEITLYPQQGTIKKTAANVYTALSASGVKLGDYPTWDAAQDRIRAIKNCIPWDRAMAMIDTKPDPLTGQPTVKPQAVIDPGPARLVHREAPVERATNPAPERAERAVAKPQRQGAL